MTRNDKRDFFEIARLLLISRNKETSSICSDGSINSVIFASSAVLAVGPKMRNDFGALPSSLALSKARLSLASSAESANTKTAPVIGGSWSCIRCSISRLEIVAGFQVARALTIGAPSSWTAATTPVELMRALAAKKNEYARSTPFESLELKNRSTCNNTTAEYPCCATGSTPGVEITNAGSLPTESRGSFAVD